MKRMMSVAAALAVTATLGAFTAAVANAEPIGKRVCDQIDQDPSPDGVANLVEALMAGGLSPSETGRLVKEAVVDFCPYDDGAVEAMLSRYG